MSDTGDLTAKIGIDASVTGAESVSALATGVGGLSQTLLQLSQSAVQNTNVQAQLNAALNLTKTNVGTLASSISLYRKEMALSNAMVRQNTASLLALDAAQKRVAASGKMTASLSSSYSQTASHLNAMNSSVGVLNKTMRSNAIESFGRRLQQSGIQSQRVGMQMARNVTLPLIGIFRTAFFSYTRLEREQVRLTKLISDGFGTGEEAIIAARKAVDELNPALDKITRKFGTSRILVQSLAGDFAELGVPTNAITDLALLTVQLEKLGNLDIGQSQQFIQSIYQNILRVKRDSAEQQGFVFDITNAEQMSDTIEQLRGQLAIFNLMENKTTLSLKDIADAFPEMSAAATSFGLSMTSTAAMLVPMVAAGFQVGASANSIKVSLQRMVAMTKQNTGIIRELNSALGPEFDLAAGVGMETIQKLTDGFNTLLSLKGEQGTLELFARLFGVRQGPRMETAIRQFAQFQKALETTGSAENAIAKELEDKVNFRLKANGMEEVSLKKILDLTNLNRDSVEKVNGVYSDRAKVIQDAQKEATDSLGDLFGDTKDFLAKVGTESGKGFLMEAVGGAAYAGKQMEIELQLSIDTAATRFDTLRESVMGLGRAIVPIVDVVVKAILPVVQKIEDFFKGLSVTTRKFIGAFMGLALIIPMVSTLTSTFKILFGSSIAGFSKMFLSTNGWLRSLKGVKSQLVDIADVINNPRIMKGYNAMAQFGESKVQLYQDPSKPGYSNKLLGRRKMTPGLEGVSQPVREAMERGGITDPNSLASMKATLRGADKLGLPNTQELLHSFATEMEAVPAKIAKASTDAVDKTAKTIAKTLKGTVFQNNTFVGNKFGGGAPGTTPGTTPGSRTPKSPAGGGTPAPLYPTPTGAPITTPAPLYPTPTGAPITPSSYIHKPNPRGMFPLPTVPNYSPPPPVITHPRGSLFPGRYSAPNPRGVFPTPTVPNYIPPAPVIPPPPTIMHPRGSLFPGVPKIKNIGAPIIATAERAAAEAQAQLEAFSLTAKDFTEAVIKTPTPAKPRAKRASRAPPDPPVTPPVEPVKPAPKPAAPKPAKVEVPKPAKVVAPKPAKVEIPKPAKVEIPKTPKVKVKAPKSAAAGVKKAVETVAKNTVAAVEGTVGALTEASAGAAAAVENVTKSAGKAAKVATKTAKVATGQGAKVILTYKEITDFFTAAGQQLPEEYDFIRTVDREIALTQKAKKDFFKNLTKEFEKKSATPLGKVSGKGQFKSYKIFGDAARNAPSLKKPAYLPVVDQLLLDRLDSKVSGQNLSGPQRSTLATAHSSMLQGVADTSGVNKYDAVKAARAQRKIRDAQSAANAIAGNIADSAPGITPPSGVEEIYTTRPKAEIAAIEKRLAEAKANLKIVEKEGTDVARQLGGTYRKQVDDLTDELKLARSAIHEKLVPASRATSQLLTAETYLMRDNMPIQNLTSGTSVSGKGIGPENPIRYANELSDKVGGMERVVSQKGSPVTLHSDIRAKILHDLEIEKLTQKILDSTDESIIRDLKSRMAETADDILDSDVDLTGSDGNRKATAKEIKKVQKETARRMAENKGVDLTKYLPTSDEFDPSAEAAILKNKKVVSGVTDLYKGIEHGGDELVAELADMKKDVAPARILSRKKLAQTFARQRDAINPAKSQWWNLSGSETRTVQPLRNIVSGGMGDLPPTPTAAGVAKKAAGGGKKAAAAVKKGMVTIQSIVDQSIDDFVDKLPSSYQKVERDIIRQVAKATVAANPPDGTGNVLRSGFNLLNTQVDEATAKVIKDGLDRQVVDAIRTIKKTPAIHDGKASGYVAAAKAKLGMLFKGTDGSVKGILKNTANLVKASNNILVDALGSGTFALAGVKGQIKGDPIKSMTSLTGGGMSARIQQLAEEVQQRRFKAARQGVESSESERTGQPNTRRKSKAADAKASKEDAARRIEEAAAAREAQDLEDAKKGKKSTDRVKKTMPGGTEPAAPPPSTTPAAEANNAATEANTVEKGKNTAANEANTVEKGKNTAATEGATTGELKDKAATTASSTATAGKTTATNAATASLVRTKASEKVFQTANDLLSGAKFQQLAAIDALTASYTAEQLATKSGLKLATARDEVRKGLNSLEKAKTDLLKQETATVKNNLVAQGKGINKNLAAAQREMERATRVASERLDTLAKASKAMTESLTAATTGAATTGAAAPAAPAAPAVAAAKETKEAKAEAARLAKEAKAEAARLAREAREESARLVKEAKAEAARLLKESREAARLVKRSQTNPFYPTPTGAAIPPATAAGAAAPATAPAKKPSRRVNIGSPSMPKGGGDSGVIKKIGELAVSFDKSLANFFKGPNFFQGPNIFQGKIISADKLKINITDKARDSARLAKARGDLIDTDDPRVVAARQSAARRNFAKLKGRIETRTGKSLTDDQLASLGRKTGYTLPKGLISKPKAPFFPTPTGAAIPPAPLYPTPTGKAIPKFATSFPGIKSKIDDVTKGVTKLTNLFSNTMPKAMHVAATAGVKSFTAVSRALASAYAISGVKAMTGGLKVVSSTADMLAAGFRISGGAVKFFNTISTSAVLTMKAMTAAGLTTKTITSDMAWAFGKLGKILASTVNTEMKAFLISLQKSKLTKAWTFMLTAGMMTFVRSLRVGIAHLNIFSNTGARLAAAKAAMTGLAAGTSLLRKGMVGLNAFTGLSAGIQAAFSGILKSVLSVVSIVIKLNAALFLIAPIVLVIAAIFIQLKKGTTNNSAALKMFKEALVLIKGAILALANPILDIINAFGGFTGATAQTQKTAGALYIMSRAFKAVAQAFNNFAQGAGQKFVKNTLGPVITRLVNRFILLGRAIRGAMRKDGTAGDNMSAFFQSLLYEGLNVMAKLFNNLSKLLPHMGGVIGAVIGAVAKASMKMLNFIGKFGMEVGLFFGSIIAGIGLALMPIAGMGAPIAAAGAALIGISLAGFAASKALTKSDADIDAWASSVGKSVANGMGTAAGKVSDLVKKGMSAIDKSYAKKIGQGINKALASTAGDPDGLKKAIEESVKKNADVAKSGGEALGAALAKGMKKKMQDIKKTFTDGFFGKADAAVDNYVDALKRGLEDQRDKALEAFDNQADAIQELADAEGRLTDKIEYEEKKRLLIKTRTLDQENYLRERKVAAYEGRSEDVRSLDLANQKSKGESVKEEKELDLSRLKTLQGEQRDKALAVIAREKDLLAKEYEKMFRDFDAQIEKIKTVGFSTEDEFKTLLSRLGGASQTFSDEITKTFSASMLALPSAIREVTDPSIGMFTVTMDKLVTEAQSKFGAANGSANATSILGAAYMLATGMPDAFKTAFTDGIIAQFVTPWSSKVTAEIAGVIPRNLWIEAAGFALLEMVNSLKRELLALKGTLWDDFKKLFEATSEVDFNTLFGDALSGLAGIKAYMTGLFAEITQLASDINLIEINREKESAGGGDEAKKPNGAALPGEDKGRGVKDNYKEVSEGYKEYLRGQMGKTPAAGKSDGGGFFGGIKDAAVGLAKVLGPVKTAILGVVGAIAGFLILQGLFSFISTVMGVILGALMAVSVGTAAVVASIGIVIGLFIYLYIKVKGFRDFVNGAVIAAWEALGAVIGFVWDGIKTGVSAAWDAIKDFAQNTWNFMKDVWDAIGGIVVDTFKKIISFFVDGFNALKDNIGGFVDSYINLFKGFWGAIWDGIKTIAAPIMEFLGKIAMGIGIVIGAIVAFFGGLIVVVVNIFDKIKGPLFSVIGFVIDIFSTVFDIVTPILRFGIGIVADIIALPFKLLNIAIDIVVGAIKIGIGIIVLIVQGAIGLITGIFDALKGPLGGPFEAVLGIIKTVFEKIKDIISGVIDFIKGVFSNLAPAVEPITAPFVIAFDFIKDLFGKIFGVVTDVFGKVFDVYKAIWGKIFDVVRGVFESIVSFLQPIVETILKILIAPFVMVFDIFKAIANNPIVGFIARVVAGLAIFAAIIATWGVKLVFELIADTIQYVYEKVKALGEAVWNILGAAFSWLGDKISAVWNAISDAWNKITAKFREFKEWFNANFGSLWNLVFLPFVLIYEGIRWVFNYIKEHAGPIIREFWQNFKDRIDAVWDKITAFADWVSNIFSAVWNAIGPMINKFWEGLKDLIGDVWGAITGFADWISNVFSSVWNGLKDIVSSVWGGIKDAVDTVYDALLKVALWIDNFFSAVWEDLGPIISALWDGLKKSVDVVWEALKSLGSWLSDVFHKIWDGIGPVIQKVWDGIVSAVDYVWEKLKAFASWLNDKLGGAWNAVSDIISKVWDKIVSGVTLVKDKLIELRDWLLDKLGMSWEEFKVKAYIVFLVIKRELKKVYEKLKDFASWLKDKLGAAWDTVSDAAGKLWDIISKVWDKVGPVLGWMWDKVTALAGAIKDKLQPAFEKIGEVIQDLWGIFEPIFGYFWDKLIWIGGVINDYVITPFRILWDLIVAGWNLVKPVFEAMWDWLGPKIGPVIDYIKEGFHIVWDTIGKGWTWVKDIFSDMYNWLKDKIGSAVSTLADLWDKVWDSIKKGWDWVKGIFSDMYNWLKDKIAWVINNIKELWDKFVNKIKDTWNGIVEIFQKISDKIRNAIGNAIENIVDKWNSFTAKMDEIWEQVKTIATNIGSWIKDKIGGAITFIRDLIGLIPATFKGVVNIIINAWNTMWKKMDSVAFPNSIWGIPLPPFMAGKSISDYINLPLIAELKYNGGKIGTYMKGGMAYGAGGMTNGPVQQGIPAILHGGEYVINHKAVQRIGTDTLDRLNNYKLSKPNLPSMPSVPRINMPGAGMNAPQYAQSGSASSSTQNVNIFVENFIGEPEWFNGMMKDYNTKVLPRNQKAAGVQSRVVSTYNGINKGL